jgi:hypothetical protein
MRVEIASSCRSLEGGLVKVVLDHVGNGLTHELALSHYFGTRRDPQ